MDGVAMRARLPAEAEALCERLEAAFSRQGEELYLVGGSVRDALLGATGAGDLDFATSAHPPRTRAALKAAGAEALYDVGERFGTIGALFGGTRVEVTTYRAEAYEEGSRKPAVEFGSSLDEDLARRDFTVNAIALRVSEGQPRDPFGGLADLARGLVRAVGDPAERFREDPLRLLRAVRFVARLGFELDEATARAAEAEAQTLRQVSRERVRDELNRLLVGPAPARGVLLLCDLGLAEHAELGDLLKMRGMRQEAGRHKDVFGHTLQVLDRTPPRLATRWAGLLHDVAKPRTLRVEHGKVSFHGHDRVGERMARKTLEALRVDADLIGSVGRLVGLHLRANAYESDWTDGAVRRFVREAGDELLDELLALSRADVTSGKPERRMAIAASVAELEARIVALRASEDIARLHSPLDGVELMALFDRGPGPWIRPIKDHLLELVLDGELHQDDKAAAEPIARRLYAELGLGNSSVL